MKHVHIALNDNECKKAEQVKQKKNLTWKELLLKGIKNGEG